VQRFTSLSLSEKRRVGETVAKLVPYVQSVSLSEGAKSTYAAHFKTLVSACQAFDFDPLKMGETELCQVALFFALSHSIHSLDSFLSAIAFVYAERDLPFPRSAALKSLKKGLLRLFTSSDTPVRAFPLSTEEVSAILAIIDMNDPMEVVFACWLSLSFLHALRPEDLEKLRWSDVTFTNDGGMDVSIRSGKGATVRGTQTYSSPSNQSPLNPANWFRRCAAMSPPSFSQSSHHVLCCLDPKNTAFLQRIPRGRFTKHLSAFYARALGKPPPGKLTAYSLRRGAATAYHDAGAHDNVVSQILRHKNFSTSTNYIDNIATREARLRMSAYLLRADQASTPTPTPFSFGAFARFIGARPPPRA
jgi:integrase